MTNTMSERLIRTLLIGCGAVVLTFFVIGVAATLRREKRRVEVFNEPQDTNAAAWTRYSNYVFRPQAQEFFRFLPHAVGFISWTNANGGPVVLFWDGNGLDMVIRTTNRCTVVNP